MDPIQTLFATKVLPRVTSLGPSEISCRVIVQGSGTWELGMVPVRSEIELDGDALLTLRETDARDTAGFVRSGRIRLRGDELHALQTLAFLAQGDLFFGPQMAFNTRPGLRVSCFSVFAAPQAELSPRFPGWHEPRAVTERNPFTGREEKRAPRGVRQAAFYVPFEPPFPFVELPIDYHYPAELVVLYGRIMGWPDSQFPATFEDVDAQRERLFTTILSNGGVPPGAAYVEVSSLDRAFRDRLASMTADEWSALVPLLGFEDPRMNAPFHALSEPLRGLAAGARDRGEDLWLFGRA